MKRNLLQCMARVLLLPVALMFICGALVSAHAEYSGPKVRFRLAHPCPPAHHTSMAFEKFAELVAQKSKNKIKVHVFPNAVLGSDVVMLKGALTGGGYMVFGLGLSALASMQLPGVLTALSELAFGGAVGALCGAFAANLPVKRS